MAQPSSIVLLALYTASLLFLSANGVTPVDPDDLTCRTAPVRGAPAIPCAKGQICVITSFGDPPRDIPDSGLCRDLSSSPPPMCSLSFCASSGSKAACKVPSPPANILQTVITCELWTKTDAGNCNNFFCTQDCPADAVSSLGKVFCNSCILQTASCRAGFSFTGPIDVNAECSSSRISPFLFGFCCKRFGKGCVPKGEPCSTGGGLFPTPPCEQGTTCVLTDFGFPAADGPSRGTCRKTPQNGFRKCSLYFCGRYGARAVCDVDGSVATCKAWATRKDSGRKPNCNLQCIRFCKRPIRSSRQYRRCLKCLAIENSCRSGFMKTFKY